MFFYKTAIVLLLCILQSLSVLGRAANWPSTDGQDTIRISTRHTEHPIPSFHLGFDFLGLISPLINNEVIQAGVSVQTEWRNNYFFTIETGAGRLESSTNQFIHNADAFFFRAGPDFGLLKRDPAAIHDVLLASLRYGYGRMKVLESLPDDLDEGIQWSEAAASTNHAHWLEAGVGIKTGVWGPVAMGWSIRAKIMLSQGENTVHTPPRFVGYGKTDNGLAVMLHYSIFVNIPSN